MKQWPRVRCRQRNCAGVLKVDWCIDLGKISGKRVTEFRPTKTEALDRAMEIRNDYKEMGESAVALTAEQKMAAVRAFQRLGETISLDKVVDLYLSVQIHSDKIKTVGSVQEELIASQRTKGLRETSISETICRYRKFVALHEKRPVQEVTETDVFNWLTQNKYTSQNTKANAMRYLNIFFNFAIKRGYATRNPMESLDFPRRTYVMPEYLQGSDVESILRAAENLAPAMIPKLAIGFFAGIRPEELNKLTWGDVKLEALLITVRPEVAKCGVPRHVTISPNLAGWLTRYRSGESGDLIGPQTKAFNLKRSMLMKAAGVSKWPHDAMRHTFATYHLAAFEDAGKTAFELGHTNGVRLLYQHYRGLATKTEAERYWNINVSEGIRNKN